MKAKFIKAISAVTMLLFLPFAAKAGTPKCLIVVEKDGNVVETPIPDVSRVDFDTFSFSVQTKDGGTEKYDYNSVKRIEFDSHSGITLLQKT